MGRSLLLACVALCACAGNSRNYQDLASTGVGVVARTKQLPSADVSSDLSLLEYALDRAYVGGGFVPKAAWTALRARLTGLQGQALTVERLCDEIGDALWMLPDAHLMAYRRESDGNHRCGTEYRRTRRRPSVGANYAADQTRSPWQIELLTTGGATYSVLALKSLPPHGDPVWNEFDGALRALADSDGVLIDLRGNSGGDDSRGRQLARFLVDGPVQSKARRVHVRQTPETLTLQINAIEREGRKEGGQIAPHLKELYDQLNERRARALAKGAAEWVVEDVSAPGVAPGKNAYRGPIAVLVDAGCASSCEGTLQALRTHPRVRVFGERTGGFVHFGELGLLALPGSGIEIQVPTKYWELPDGKLFDKVGFEPDVAVAAGSDAFVPAMDWLRAEVPRAEVMSASSYSVPEGMRTREAARLKSLGLEPPPGGLVLEKPFAAPLNRRSFIVPQGWLFRRLPKVVFAPALRADLQVLEAAMSRAYGGWAIAEQHGWRWSDWFADWDKRLASAGSAWLPLKDAFDPVRRLQQFQLDNHTTIPLGLRFGSGSRVALLEAPPTGPCTELEDRAGTRLPLVSTDPAQQPKKALRFDGAALGDAHYVAYPQLRGDLAAIHCGKQRIALSPATTLEGKALSEQVQRLSGQADGRPWLRHLSASVAYLRLPTFSKVNGERIERERKTWDQRTGAEKLLLVDLRGNDGGDAAFGALAGWVDESELRSLLAHDMRKGASCLYPALRWGYASMSSFGVKAPLTDQLRAGLQSGLDQLKGTDDAACAARFVEEKAKRRYRERKEPPRKGKPIIALLVDGGCGSDCELIVEVLSKLPEAVVVGTNTYGVAQFIQPGYSVLPNTRLPFRIALGTSDAYGDRRSFDGYGLDVDILMDSAAAYSDEGLARLTSLLAARAR